MTATLAYGHSSESPCALDYSNLSIGRFNPFHSEATFFQGTRLNFFLKTCHTYHVGIHWKALTDNHLPWPISLTFYLSQSFLPFILSHFFFKFRAPSQLTGCLVFIFFCIDIM